MNLKNYVFEGLIVLTLAVGLAAFYFLYLQEGQALEKPILMQQLSAQAVDNNDITSTTDVGLAPADLLKIDPVIILRLHGSNTIGGKLVPAIAAAYLRSLGSDVTVTKTMERANESVVVGYLPHLNQVVGIEIKAHGSTTGFKSLIDDKTDIAMSSRPIKHEENLDLIINHGDMTNAESEHIIALDGLAIVVHPDNPLKQITVAQLADIFSGKIKNWSQIGGNNKAIQLYARDDQSGTFDTFKSLILKKYDKKLGAAKRFESNAELVEQVSNDPDAIGFSGLAYAQKNMILAVSAEQGLPSLIPHQFSISSEDYPLSRRLFLYANKLKSSNPHIREFIDFSVSFSGQQIAESVNFIPQKITTQLPMNVSNFPAKYQQLVRDGERLSMTFRMRADRAEIDNKSMQDIDNLVSFLRNQSYDKIRLIGFSAGESNDINIDRNRALVRSRLLAYELRQRGVRNVEVMAFGEQIPIDSNQNSYGAYRNNRTEVWLIKSEESS